jgi:hypothetical protein
MWLRTRNQFLNSLAWPSLRLLFQDQSVDRRVGLLQVHLTRTPRLLTIFGCLVAPHRSRLLSWPSRMKEDRRKDRRQVRMHKSAAPVISCGLLTGTLGTRRYSRRLDRIQLLNHQQSFASLSLGVSKLMLLLSLAACPTATRASGADTAHVLLRPSSQRLTSASSATVTRMRVRTSVGVVRRVCGWSHSRYGWP